MPGGVKCLCEPMRPIAGDPWAANKRALAAMVVIAAPIPSCGNTSCPLRSMKPKKIIGVAEKI